MTNLLFVFNRVKNLLISPKAEWNKIREETITKNEILKRYALPLLIILVVCSVIGDFIFASRYIFSLGFVVIKAIITFAIAFVSMYFSAIIINEITTSFNSKKDLHITFKLVVYSFTAYLITEAFAHLLPPLGIVHVFAFYSIYLFWLGSKPLLETPDDNRMGFVVVSSLILIGIYTIVYFILGSILTGIFGASLLMN